VNNAYRFIAVCVLIAGAAVPTARADEKDIIEYRQHLMATMNEQSAALGQILSTSIPDDNVIAHLDAIALSASIALKSFEHKAPGGEAKPEVWSNWADFSKRMNEFARNTSQAARTAREKGASTAMSNILDALTCKGCHETYREEKKR